MPGRVVEGADGDIAAAVASLDALETQWVRDREALREAFERQDMDLDEQTQYNLLANSALEWLALSPKDFA